ncbi:MarR family transcriptional regulator [Hamadaea sp. NPDC050747]|uniref:MarR family winged helix-turn-helix transcriptional regulator n=1 Tax=Hamadaea sp. NPDC050747 TaxID=3155789 RepID=UPI0033E42A82
MVDGLMALSRALVALTVRSLNELDTDVTLTQYRTLIVLASQGPQRTADLAHEVGVRPSTASRMCDRLVTRGLVRRQPDDADRRVVWVALTESGKDLVGQAMTLRRQLLSQLLADAGVHDGEAFAATAERLAAAAGELPDPMWWLQWRQSTDLTGPDVDRKAA